MRQIADVLSLDYNYLLTLNGSIDDEPELRIISRASKKMSAEDKKRMLETLRKMFDEAFTDVDSDIPSDEK